MRTLGGLGADVVVKQQALLVSVHCHDGLVGGAQLGDARDLAAQDLGC